MVNASTPGRLIVLEGIDGTGKSTQAKTLLTALSAAGYDTLYSREPTDGPWGKKIRALAGTGRMPLDEELAAFIADRKEHCADVLRPSLAAGKIIVLDRYYFSTAAYQGARGADPAQILRDNEAFAPQPDLLFILELPIQVSLSRIAKRGLAVDAFEKEDSLIRCHEIFQSIDRPYVCRIDANRTESAIAAEIFKKVTPILPQPTR